MSVHSKIRYSEMLIISPTFPSHCVRENSEPSSYFFFFLFVSHFYCCYQLDSKELKMKASQGSGSTDPLPQQVSKRTEKGQGLQQSFSLHVGNREKVDVICNQRDRHRMSGQRDKKGRVDSRRILEHHSYSTPATEQKAKPTEQLS